MELEMDMSESEDLKAKGMKIMKTNEKCTRDTSK
jgi:hypothetical protein